MNITDKLHREMDGCAVALGTFDGVHLGHRKVISLAAQSGFTPIIATFDQNPQAVLNRNCKQYRLISRSLNAAEFEYLGVKTAVFLDFSSVMNLTPTEFLDLLIKETGAKFISCGYNFRFGKNASGTAELLQEYAAAHSIGCTICPRVEMDGDAVSSSRIRALVSDGKMEEAARLLTRPYAFDFKVVQGDRRGRTIGFPTINQVFDSTFVLPRFGVYASRTYIGETPYLSITNVGIRPTFLSEHVLAETFISDFSGDLYSQHIKVELLRFLRAEQKFHSLEELKANISADLEKARS